MPIRVQTKNKSVILASISYIIWNCHWCVSLLKFISEFIETGILHKYAKLRHAISIFGDGKCFTLEDVIMSLCNSNCLWELLRSQKISRKNGNNAYSIRPDTYIMFPLYCMPYNVQANARQRHKLTFRHHQYV